MGVFIMFFSTVSLVFGNKINTLEAMTFAEANNVRIRAVREKLPVSKGTSGKDFAFLFPYAPLLNTFKFISSSMRFGVAWTIALRLEDRADFLETQLEIYESENNS